MTALFFDQAVYEVCRDKARKDPGYAIAYAILELARRHDAFVDRVSDLGIGGQLEELAEAVHAAGVSVAGAVGDGVTDLVNTKS